MLKTLQFKLRNPPTSFLVQASKEVNFCWNWANETSFKAIVKYSGKPEFLSGFDLNKLSTPTRKTDPFTQKKINQSLGFSQINSAIVQAINHEYVTRRQQFHKRKLNWRKSTGSEKSLGWVPLKQENISVSLQDKTTQFRRVAGKGVDLSQIKTYDFSHLSKNLRSISVNKPRFSIKILGKNFHIFNPQYLKYYLLDLSGTLKSGSFSQDSLGDWYLNLSIEVNNQTYQTKHLQQLQNYPMVAPKESVGIDLNAKADSFIALSSGQKLASSNFYKNSQAKIKALASNGHKKQLKYLHRRIKRKRSNELHHQANYVVKTFQTIKTGDLKTRQLVKTKSKIKSNKNQPAVRLVKKSTKKSSFSFPLVQGQPSTKAKPQTRGLHLGKSLLDNAPGEFTRLLSFKSRWAGRNFYKVNEAKTTIACSKCDAFTGPTGLRQLSVRTWVCDKCLKKHDRDICAAQNTRRVPVEGKLVDILKPQPCSSQGKESSIVLSYALPVSTGSALASVSRNK